MRLEKDRAEPCGAGNFPDEVLRPVGGDRIVIPMEVALTTDRKTMLLMDSVDYYQTQNLSKREAEALAEKFRQLAEAMVDEVSGGGP